MIRGPQSLPGHGQDTLAILSSALGDELFNPYAKGFDTRGGKKGYLVTAGHGQLTHCSTQGQPRVFGNGNAVMGGVKHGDGSVEKLLQVYADQGGWHQAEVGEGGVTAAHIRWRGEHATQLFLSRERFQRGAGICDGHEVLAWILFYGADGVVEELEEGERFSGPSRFAGDEKEGVGHVNTIRDIVHGGGMSAIENGQGWVAGCVAKSGHVDFRCQTAPPHPKQNNVSEPLLSDPIGKIVQGIQLVVHHLGDGQPAEAIYQLRGQGGLLWVRHPYGGVFSPDAASHVGLAP